MDDEDVLHKVTLEGSMEDWKTLLTAIDWLVGLDSEEKDSTKILSGFSNRVRNALNLSQPDKD